LHFYDREEERIHQESNVGGKKKMMNVRIKEMVFLLLSQ